MDYYHQALTVLREVGNRSAEAATLSNIGQVHNRRGDYDTALRYYQQALPIQQDIGHRSGQASTRFNIALVFRSEGRLTEAVVELEAVVKLDQALGHPDLASDTAMLEQVRAELAKSPGISERGLG